jgi:hypothetical protein
MAYTRIYGRNFGRVPDELLWDTTVSGDACKLYAVLTRYGQRGDRVVPERKELATKMGWSVRTLDRRIGELEAKGALYVHPEHDPTTGRQVASSYWVDGLRPEGVTAVRGRVTNLTPPKGETDMAPGEGDKSDAPIEQEHALTSSSGNPGSEESSAAPTAQTYIGALVDYIRTKTGDAGYSPGPRVAGMWAVELKVSIEAGASDEHIRAGCRYWADRDLHPRTLGSCIDGARRGGQRRRYTKTGLEVWTDDQWTEAIRQMEEQDGQDGMGQPGASAPGVLPESADATGNGGRVVAER